MSARRLPLSPTVGGPLLFAYDAQPKLTVRMSRPFRFEAPVEQSSIRRRRVQAVLRERFEHRVTVIEAGAGMGKTTALVGALAENQLSPRGIDLWIGCESGDEAAAHLLAGLGEVVGCAAPIADGTDEAVAAIVEAVAMRSPAQVCLLLDDVHLLGSESSGLAAVGQLVELLPANGHLLLASRRTIPFALARLEAQGRVGRVDAEAMTLNSEEVASLTKGRSDIARFAALGGWPALISLAMRTETASDFVREEVLSSLSVAETKALQVLVAVGGGDEAMIEHVAEVSVAALEALPLVHRRGQAWEAHDLWNDIVLGAVTTAELDGYRQRAVRYLDQQRNHVAAVDVCLLGSSMQTELRRKLRDVMVYVLEPPLHDIRRWLTVIPKQLVNDPAVRVLRAFALRDGDPASDLGEADNVAAQQGFRALGDAHAEATALGQVIFKAYVKRDTARLMELYERCGQLADEGVSIAQQIMMLGAATVAAATGDRQAMLHEVQRMDPAKLDPMYRSIMYSFEAAALSQSGYPSLEVARKGQTHARALPGTSDTAMWALFRHGMVAEMLDLLAKGPAPGLGGRDRFLWEAWAAGVAILSGDQVAASGHLAAAELLNDGQTNWRADIQVALLRAAIEVESSDPDEIARGVDRLRNLVAAHPVGDLKDALYLVFPRLLYVFLPEVRQSLLDRAVGPFHHRDFGLLQALVELHEVGQLDAIRHVEWPELHTNLLTTLGLRGAAEFIVAAESVGRSEAAAAGREIIDLLGPPARDAFRQQLQHPISGVVEAARSLLETIPAAPAEIRRVCFLGPSELWFGPERVESSDWGRDKVRSLFGFLALNPIATRDTVMAALWPDATEESARRSFRSTLSLLLKTLEPKRLSGDAPFTVRSDGESIRLHRTEGLDVDIWTFDALIDSAASAEADGVPSMAIAPLTQAVDMYRGDLLIDTTYDDWVGFDRDRLRSRFIAAAVRSGELLLAQGDVDGAGRMASRALASEPWAEAGHRLLISSYIQRGDRAAALRALNRCREEMAEIGGPVDELTDMLARRLVVG